jgi:hypothetical protein
MLPTDTPYQSYFGDDNPELMILGVIESNSL